ncbi:MAG: hypothetical protein SFY80_01085 [Verrucomicrobiota bacterium]|nr:hypothetical protein [Verrucomicrobiota bacterium]
MKNTSILLRNILAAVLLSAGFTSSAAKFSTLAGSVEINESATHFIASTPPCVLPPKYMDPDFNDSKEIV